MKKLIISLESHFLVLKDVKNRCIKNLLQLDFTNTSTRGVTGGEGARALVNNFAIAKKFRITKFGCNRPPIYLFLVS